MNSLAPPSSVTWSSHIPQPSASSESRKDGRNRSFDEPSAMALSARVLVAASTAGMRWYAGAGLHLRGGKTAEWEMKQQPQWLGYPSTGELHSGEAKDAGPIWVRSLTQHWVPVSLRCTHTVCDILSSHAENRCPHLFPKRGRKHKSMSLQTVLGGWGAGSSPDLHMYPLHFQPSNFNTGTRTFWNSRRVHCKPTSGNYPSIPGNP